MPYNKKQCAVFAMMKKKKPPKDWKKYCRKKVVEALANKAS